METYRVNSKLRENNKEYLIQTANDANLGLVETTIYIDGVPAESASCPHPEDIKPQEVMSLVNITHGEKKKEIEHLLQSYHTVMQGGSPEAMFHLGTAFLYKGFCHEARDLFLAATAANKEYHQAYNQLCITEQVMGNIARAIESGSRAVELRPKYADYRNALGEAYLSDDSPRKALTEFEEAIRINLYYGDAYFNLGLAKLLLLLKQGRLTNPEEELAGITDCLYKASLITPGYKGQAFDEGMKALKRRDLETALRALKVIREAKKEKHRQEFAGFYMKLILFPQLSSEQAVRDRIDFLKGEITKNPSYVDLQAELGRCYLEMSRMTWQRGVEQYRKTAELGPTLTEIQSALDTAERVHETIISAVNRISSKG